VNDSKGKNTAVIDTFRLPLSSSTYLVYYRLNFCLRWWW